MPVSTQASQPILSSQSPQCDRQCIFSVDVEDWYHALPSDGTPDTAAWDRLPSRVEANFRHLLAMFAEKKVHATCFFLGWVGQKFPHLVREAAAAGHEIASHGYAHQVVFSMKPKEFGDDLRKAKDPLEQAGGVRVRGYRSPAFSCTEDTPWFFDELAGAGYEYDSSVFPAERDFGGLQRAPRAPYFAKCSSGARIAEFPISIADFARKPMCFFGGGYLRLFPYWVIRNKSEQVLKERRPVTFYIHPREIDPGHPRLPMNPLRRFKSYVGIRGTEAKLRRILDEFPVTTFADYLARNRVSMETEA